jgi:hypothetical protein
MCNNKPTTVPHSRANVALPALAAMMNARVDALCNYRMLWRYGIFRNVYQRNPAICAGKEKLIQVPNMVSPHEEFMTMIRRQSLLLMAAVCVACFNSAFASSSWSQNLSLPLNERPTESVVVYYSM